MDNKREWGIKRDPPTPLYFVASEEVGGREEDLEVEGNSGTQNVI